MNTVKPLKKWIPCTLMSTSGWMRHDGWHEILALAVFMVSYAALDIWFFDPEFYAGKPKV